MFKSKLTILLASFLSINAQAVSLAGDWDCKPEVHGEAAENAPKASFILSINEDLSQFIRHTELSISTGLYQAPAVVLNTVEEGTVVFIDDELILSPSDVEMDVIEGESLVTEEIEKNLKDQLLRDEIGTVAPDGNDKFSVYLSGYDQTNHCVRLK